MARKHIRILQMGKHFLYLPLYFARENNFFGFLPEDVNIEIDLSDPQTDSGAFEQLMDTSPRNRAYVMAITDPVQVLKSDLEAKIQPVVLAAMVTNGAFWAVNHGSRTISALRQLGEFNQILAFEPGTTSYTVASRIAQQSGKATNMSSFIHVVEQGKELLCLNDPTTPENVVALSPDLLMIEHMIEEKTASIELALGGTPEFNDVLVTSLLSHSNFVNENPDIVNGILAGLQKALLMVRLKNEEVLRFAQDYFNFHEHVSGAMQRAVAAGVFPLSIVVAQAHWQHAARAYYEAQQNGHEWNTAQEELSLKYFDQCVQPHIAIAQEAADTVFGSTDYSERTGAEVNLIFIFLIVTLAALLTTAIGLFATLLICVGGCSAWWIAQQSFLNEKPLLKWVSAPSWFLGVAMLSTHFIKWIDVLVARAFTPFALCFLGVAVTAICTAYSLPNQQVKSE